MPQMSITSFIRKRRIIDDDSDDDTPTPATASSPLVKRQCPETPTSTKIKLEKSSPKKAPPKETPVSNRIPAESSTPPKLNQSSYFGTPRNESKYSSFTSNSPFNPDDSMSTPKSNVPKFSSNANKTPQSTVNKSSLQTPKSAQKIYTHSATPSSVLSIYSNANNGKDSGSQGDSDSKEDDWPHLKYGFLRPENIRDIEKRRPDHPDYDPRTLYVPKQFLDEQTPALRQWWLIKQRNMDAILFFKMGKFYEFFNMDAVVGVSELDIIYMKSEEDKPAHAGFPEISFSKFANILVEKGYKVLRIEQTETPAMMEERCQRLGLKSKFDKVVAREVCRVTTKGTQMMSITDQAFHTHNNQYLLAITEIPGPAFGSSDTQNSDNSIGSNSGANSTEIGVCFVDVTIGRIHIGQFRDDRHRSNLHMLIAHHTPVEILVERNSCTQLTMEVLRRSGASLVTLRTDSEFWPSRRTMIYLKDKEIYTNEKGQFYWPKFFQNLYMDIEPEVESLAGCMVKPELELSVKCFGAIVYYLDSCMIAGNVLSSGLFSIYTPPLACLANKTKENGHRDEQCNSVMPNKMILDHVALRNLEIFENSSGTKLGTLFDSVNMCKTQFGSRMLKNWMCTPLCNIDEIDSRLDAVEDLLEPSNGSLLNAIVGMLKEMPDLERMLSRILGQSKKTDADSRAILFDKDIYSKAKIKSFLDVLGHLKRVSRTINELDYQMSKLKSKSLKRLLTVDSTESESKIDGGLFPDMVETLTFFDKAFDHKQAKELGKIIPARGVDEQFDEGQEEIDEIESELENYLEQQRDFLKCKMSYFGTGKNRYQLEIPEDKCKNLPCEYQLETTRKGFKRYYTTFIRKQLDKLERAEQKKDHALETILTRIFDKFCKHYKKWTDAVGCLAQIDVIQSFVQFARSIKASNVDLCRPKFVLPEQKNGDKIFLEYNGGRHPALVKLSPNFTPNNLLLDSRLILLTGANMGGKSTLMRQTGLLVILAQMGCLVPAKTFELTPVDRIFSRLGATDRILEGESTFYTELIETSSMLVHASKHSLVLLDELGRGTATYDGTAIAYSVITEICEHIKCRCIFSTHYHSLIDDFYSNPNVRQAHMACKIEQQNENDDNLDEESITFLYKLVEGSCPKSYGFNVARLAGLSSSIVREAQSKSKEFELNFVVLNLLQQMRFENIENVSAQDVQNDDSLSKKIVESIKKMGIY